MNKLISVIIPIYNSELHLRHCLDSILNQIYTNIEIILVNDGSTDNSLSICEEYKHQDERFKLININNSGASHARNIGLSKAKGQYVSFIDSDDMIDKNMFHDMLGLIEIHKADMAECEIKYVRNHKTNKINNIEEIKLMNKDDMLNRFFRTSGEKDTHTLCNKLINIDILDDFKLIEGYMNEDVKGVYDIIKKCNKCIYTSNKYYLYYRNSSGVTNKKFNKKHLDLLYMWDLVVKEVAIDFPTYYQYAIINRKRAYFTLYLKMIRNGYNKNDIYMCKTKVKLEKKVLDYYPELIKWKIAFSRKILLYLIYIFRKE